MSDASVKREALQKIRALISKGQKQQAEGIAYLFKVDERHASIDEITFYAKVLMEIGFIQEAERSLKAAIAKANKANFTHQLESLFWQMRTKPDLRRMRSGVALSHALSLPGINSVLDVGSGGEEHALRFAQANKMVHCVDYGTSIYVQNSEALADTERHPNIRKTIGDFMTFKSTEKYDLVWCSHVLEHQVNPNLFLKKCLSHLNDNGWLAVTVPPLKHPIVGGHVTLWNAGILLYQFVLAGNDCSSALIMNYDYNITVMVPKAPVELPTLDYDSGDVDRLSKFFPPDCAENFDGRMYGHAIRNLTRC
ncbi:class I SAM-dependent methyltransferase [Sinorhizobium sp. BG8]|uniref:class I SAM-dependent methyltransferase n=1 Tax=Sinorhizobium sp. BG8 TaxID=2613773 RepID=UPI00193E2BA8|nr:class I SAM-dependent methyltransferase [Sinorhizobium sp. BG8]QRM55162.1 class I SAM-dependent methyltransferase [Sinorhizobium sp. BG8]